MHKLTVVLEKEQIGAKTHNGIEQVMDRAISLGEKQLLGCAINVFLGETRNPTYN